MSCWLTSTACSCTLGCYRPETRWWWHLRLLYRQRRRVRQCKCWRLYFLYICFVTGPYLADWLVLRSKNFIVAFYLEVSNSLALISSRHVKQHNHFETHHRGGCSGLILTFYTDGRRFWRRRMRWLSESSIVYWRPRPTSHIKWISTRWMAGQCLSVRHWRQLSSRWWCFLQSFVYELCLLL